MTVCVISQPRFFPGAHYLDRMRKADWFVVFDTVQFTPRHEENRCRLKGPDGPQWLSVPVEKHGRDEPLTQIRISRSQPWQEAARRTLHHLYGKSPHYAASIGEVEAVLDGGHELLRDLDMASWEPALRRLQPGCRFVRASELSARGKGPSLLLAICKELGCDEYLSGGFGREYLDAADFAAEGIELRFHDYEHPVYEQRHGAFVPWLSYLDMLFAADLAPAAAAARAD